MAVAAAVVAPGTSLMNRCAEPSALSLHVAELLSTLFTVAMHVCCLMSAGAVCGAKRGTLTVIALHLKECMMGRPCSQCGFCFSLRESLGLVMHPQRVAKAVPSLAGDSWLQSLGRFPRKSSSRRSLVSCMSDAIVRAIDS